MHSDSDGDQNMSTVRFSNIVERSGQPAPYTLWTDPKKDKEFQRALKAHRVMTVHQETVGTKSDYGEVGFTGDKNASLLMFPKSLAPFDGKRVIGIKYDLLDSPEPTTSAKSKTSAKPAKKPKAKRTEKPPESNVIRFVKEEKEPPKPKPAAARELGHIGRQREIRKVMKTLKAGKAVAAYRCLKSSKRPWPKRANDSFREEAGRAGSFPPEPCPSRGAPFR